MILARLHSFCCNFFCNIFAAELGVINNKTCGIFIQFLLKDIVGLEVRGGVDSSATLEHGLAR